MRDEKFERSVLMARVSALRFASGRAEFRETGKFPLETIGDLDRLDEAIEKYGNGEKIKTIIVEASN